MPLSLFIFAAQGVASPQSEYRTGARHALNLFATGTGIDEARSKAIAGAHQRNWLHVEIQREMDLGESPVIEDDILRTAAEGAVRDGSAVVAYGTEIPLDS